jgi:hypothetical protein
MRVALRQRNHERGDVLREEFPEVGRIRMQHLRHPRHLGCLLRRLARLVAGHQHVDVRAELLRGGDGVQRGFLDLLVVVFS